MKIICSGTEIQGLKMGVSRAAHTQYAYIWTYPPGGGGGGLQIKEFHRKTGSISIF